MAVTITKIDDNENGFRVEFEVRATFSQVFEKRPINRDQMDYAREVVATAVPVPVETPAGVFVIPKPVFAPVPEEVIIIEP